MNCSSFDGGYFKGYSHSITDEKIRKLVYDKFTTDKYKIEWLLNIQPEAIPDSNHYFLIGFDNSEVVKNNATKYV